VFCSRGREGEASGRAPWWAARVRRRTRPGSSRTGAPPAHLVRRAQPLRVHEEHRDLLAGRCPRRHRVAAEPDALRVRRNRVPDAEPRAAAEQLVHQERLAGAVPARDDRDGCAAREWAAGTAAVLGRVAGQQSVGSLRRPSHAPIGPSYSSSTRAPASDTRKRRSRSSHSMSGTDMAAHSMSGSFKWARTSGNASRSIDDEDDHAQAIRRAGVYSNGSISTSATAAKQLMMGGFRCLLTRDATPCPVESGGRSQLPLAHRPTER
jgi:hypothetical protein